MCEPAPVRAHPSKISSGYVLVVLEARGLITNEGLPLCWKPNAAAGDIHTTAAAASTLVLVASRLSHIIWPPTIPLHHNITRLFAFPSTARFAFGFDSPCAPLALGIISTFGRRRYRCLIACASWTFIWTDCVYYQASLLPDLAVHCNNCDPGLFFNSLYLLRTFLSTLWFMIVPRA